MAKTSPSVLQIDLPRARAAWMQNQGLRRELEASSIDDLVGNTGWVRALGGADVYFALWARRPSADRHTLDAAVVDGSLRIVPAVRGCMYLVPQKDVPWTMGLAAQLARPRVLRDLEKVDLPWSVIEDVMQEVESALSDGPLDTHGLRKVLSPDSVRGLGEKGKKIGLSSPLPVALREMEFRCRIRRTPVGMHLDTERYLWQLDDTTATVPDDRAALVGAVVERVFRFFAPASIKEVAAWMGLPQRDIKSAMADLPLVPIDIEGRGQAWAWEDSLESLKEPAAPSTDVRFLGFEDNLLTFYGGPGVFADSAHHDHMMASWGRGKPATLGTTKHPTQRCLMVGDDLVGFWEFDAAQDRVVVGGLDTLPQEAHPAIEKGRAFLEHQIRDVLGHARCFSIDTDDAIARRAALVQDMA